MLGVGPAVEAEAGDAGHGERHHQHIARLAAGVIGGGAVHGGDVAVRKGVGVKTCGGFGTAVKPQADGVLGHGRHAFTPALIIHGVPKRSVTRPKPSAQKVASYGMVTFPPSASALKMRSPSAALSRFRQASMPCGAE